MKLVHFYQKLVLTTKAGSTYTLISTSKAPNTISMGHTNTYTSSTTPSSTEITIQYLTEKHMSWFKKGVQIDLTAGWFNADASAKVIHKVTSGTITEVTPPVESEDNSTLTFTVRDGQNYDDLAAKKIKKTTRVRQRASQKDLDTTISTYNSSINKKRKAWIDEHPKASQKEVTRHNKYYSTLKKNFATNARVDYNRQRKSLDNAKKYQIKTTYEYRSFKKGTKGSVIIKQIAKDSGIKIARMKLNVDHVYRDGYTAKKKPMKCIEEIAKDCATDIFWPHGELYIETLKKQRKRDIHINKDTGLLAKPQKSADGDGKQWTLTFLYRTIATGDVFYINHDRIKGWVIALNGTNAVEPGGLPTSTAVVELYSDYQAAKAKTINAKKKTEREAKKKADKKARDAHNNKRATRNRITKYATDAKHQTVDQIAKENQQKRQKKKTNKKTDKKSDKK